MNIVFLEEVKRGDVVKISKIDRSSDGLLVAAIRPVDKYNIQICFSGGLNYVLPKRTLVEVE